MAHSCPTCGRAYPKAKVQPIHNVVDLTQLPDEDLYAYFKQTAPVADVQFGLKHSILSPSLREDWEALYIEAPVMKRAEVYRRLRLLQDRWRVERNEADRRVA